MTVAAPPPLAPAARVRGVITGWHVLIAMVAFFGVIIAIDTIFIVQAYRSFSGQVASNPYEAGLAFNRTLAQRRREAELGWTASVETPAPGIVVVHVRDRAGQVVPNLSLTGVLERPATEAGRQVLNFRPDGQGGYRAEAHLDGAWDLRATARTSAEAFEIETRLVQP